MKNILLMGLGLLPAALFAQQDFTLSGKIANAKPEAKIFIQYQSAGQRVLDSALVQNGAFKYQGSVVEPTQARLILSSEGKSFPALRESEVPPEVNSIYLAQGNLVLEGPDFKSSVIKGNAVNEDFTRYKTGAKALEEEFSALNAAYQAASEAQQQDEEFVKGLQEKAAVIYAKQNDANAEFVKANPKSYVSLSVLAELANPGNLTTIVQPAYAALSPELKNTALGKTLGTKIEAMSKLAIGAVAPDFSLADTTGKELSLSSLRGKYVLVDFWASWCGPCRQENPNVVAAFNKYKDKNFTILGVSLDNPGKKDNWLKAISDDQLQQWPHVSDLSGWKSKVVELYAIQGIPQNYLLDPEGKIVASNLRGEALEEKLAEILK